MGEWRNGRRAWLRTTWGNPCRFKSCLAHHPIFHQFWPEEALSKNSSDLVGNWQMTDFYHGRPLRLTKARRRVAPRTWKKRKWPCYVAPPRVSFTRLLRSRMRLYAYAASSATSQERSSEAGRIKQLANAVQPNCRSASPGHGHPLHAIAAAKSEIRFEMRVRRRDGK